MTDWKVKYISETSDDDQTSSEITAPSDSGGIISKSAIIQPQKQLGSLETSRESRSASHQRYRSPSPPENEREDDDSAADTDLSSAADDLGDKDDQSCHHLKDTYHIDDSDAHKIYDDAITLYHQLLTMIDLNPLQTIDKRILSSLIIVIVEYYSFNKLSEYLLSVIMYIIAFCQNTQAEYLFNQWIGGLCQNQDLDNGMEFLIHIY